MALSHMSRMSIECWSSALRPEPSMVLSGRVSSLSQLEAVTVILRIG